MKVCKGNELLINMYIDGELSLQEEQELKAHLESCPACRGYYEQLCLISSQILTVDFPPQLHESIMDAVDVERGRGVVKGRFRFFSPRFIGVAAAVLVVALVGVIGVQGGLLTGHFSKDAETMDTAGGQPEVVVRSASPGAENALPESNGLDMAGDGGLDDEMPREYDDEMESSSQPFTIESPMKGWFNSETDNVTVLGQSNGQQIPSDTDGDLKKLDEWAETLSVSLDGDVDGYGFYIIACGNYEELPDVFADQAEEIGPGMTLLINVKNDLSVKEQVGCSMTENGFEILEDSEGEYFEIDLQAEEGLVIVELQGE